MAAGSKSFAIVGAAALVACAPPAPPAGPAPDAEVRNIILMIADGAGSGFWSAARIASDSLAVDRMPVGGTVTTFSASSRVTDSAAAATALATGTSVTNRTVAVAATCPQPLAGETVRGRPAGCEPLASWFAIARARGKHGGVATTAAVIDATPAAFTLSSPSRYWYEALAEGLAAARPEVVLGGGRRYFAAGTRGDGLDLLGSLCRDADCVFDAAGLAASRPGDRPLVGLFGPEDLGAVGERPVALTQMVVAALARLERAPLGFVAVFETEGTDNAGHANLSLAAVAAEMIEFDRAVGIALDFAERTPGTLLIVTADHDTGGLSVVGRGDSVGAEYVTKGHTANEVPLFAYGPGAERFGGARTNAEIGRILVEIARGW